MSSTFVAPIVTRDFQRSRLALARAGCRSQVAKLDALMIQVASGEDITAAHLTRHGETRLASAEKFDLGDGYRVVTQFVKHGDQTVRVFWFAGSHDECDGWLERHKGYKYVYDPKDRRIEFVPVEVSVREGVRLVNPDISPAALDRPLLRHLDDRDWEALGVSDELRRQLLAIAHADYADSSAVDAVLRAPAALHAVLLDVMVAANEEDVDAVRARLELFHGARERAAPSAVIEAIVLPVNAEKFLTFADPEQLAELLKHDAWEAWMLFLHPAQEELARAVFDGPARLRGVSGSGKTSVVLHRARALARRYDRQVLVVTFTSSLTRLLRHLADSLCGVERNLIDISTASALASEVIRRCDPDHWSSLRAELQESELRVLRARAIADSGAAIAWRRLRSAPVDSDRQLDEAFTALRERYLVGERDLYSRTEVDGAPPEPVRRALVAAAGAFEAELSRRKTLDPAGLVLYAIDAALSARGTEVDFSQDQTIDSPFARCVLVDEAQDLSANELRLLMALTDHTAADALFIASDAAQRIFRREASLAAIGIDVTGRAYVLRKNYRNTMQVLQAARLLLDAYDIDELEGASEPTRIEVDLPTREGSRPEIIRFDKVAEETAWIAGEIERLRREEAGVLGSGVAVLSASKRHREAVEAELSRRKIPTAALRHDVVGSSAAVKISTIESAKGHEFSVVFLAGMTTDAVPLEAMADVEARREVRRFYVAATRARDRLVLTWHRQDGARPATLLTRMMAACDQYRWQAGALVRDD